jgi:methylmalonyl-CoA mutase N-terminal domain/subunit
VGRLGVAIDTLDDMVELFDELPLDKVAATFNINAPAPIIYAMFLATARRQGANLDMVTGTLSNDPLVEFVARGLWRLPPKHAMRMMADVFEHSLRQTPKFYPINIRGCLFYEAGASDEQEIAFTLACGKEYMLNLRSRGIDPNEAGIRFSYMMFADHNILEQVAKFRAARRMWATICRDELGITNESAMRFRFTSPVGSYNFKAQQPELNIIRAAYGALAGVLGGCQAMLVAGYDEAFAIPTEATAMLGLRTQQILAEETGVTKTPDPLGGSFFLESMTDAMEARATDWLDRIRDAGGMVAAIEAGIPQEAIADRAFDTEMAIESGRKRVVGVNCFVDEADDPQSRLEFHTPDPIGVESQVRRLSRHRQTRSATAVNQAISEVKRSIEAGTNVIEPMVDALVVGATIGELMTSMVETCGEHTEYVRY